MGRIKSCSTRTATTLLQSKSMFSAAIAIAFAAGLGGCVSTVDQRGNLPDAEKVAEIRPGGTRRDEVTKILGTPSSIGVFDSKNWYYISRKTKRVAFFDPDVLDQQV